MNLADELQRRGAPQIKCEGKRLVYFGVLNLPGDMTRKEQALRLHQEGLSLSQIADVMRVSRTCVRQYIIKAKARLTRWL